MVNPKWDKKLEEEATAAWEAQLHYLQAQMDMWLRGSDDSLDYLTSAVDLCHILTNAYFDNAMEEVCRGLAFNRHPQLNIDSFACDGISPELHDFIHNTFHTHCPQED